MRGRFLVFEGLDGSGTTTQATLLCANLRAAGRRAVQTSEPTLGPVGVMIRHILSGRAHFSHDDALIRRHLAFLFAADRHDHLYNDVDGVLMLLEQGVDVLSTRYFLSSMAYNASSTEDLEFVSTLNASFPLPDVTFFVTCSLDECLRRIGSDVRSQDRHENAATLRLVMEGYARALEVYPGHVIKIDGEKQPSAVQAEIVANLERLVTA